MEWIKTHETVYVGYNPENGLEFEVRDVSIRIDDITSYSREGDGMTLVSMYNREVHMVNMSYDDIDDIINGYITFPQHLN